MGLAFSLLGGVYLGASAKDRNWRGVLLAGLLLSIGWLLF